METRKVLLWGFFLFGFGLLPAGGSAQLDEAMVEILNDGFTGDLRHRCEIGGVQAALLRPTGEIVTATCGQEFPGSLMPDSNPVGLADASMLPIAITAIRMSEGDEPLLDLDATVEDYLDLSLLPNVPADATVRQLLTHQSGIDDIYPGFDWELEDYEFLWDARTIHDVFIGPAHFEPGAEFEYSRANYFVLAMILEEVSESTLGDLIDEHVVTPLPELTSTTSSFTRTGGSRAEWAWLSADVWGTGYGQFLRPDTAYLSYTGGAGDVATTATQALHLIQGFFDGELVGMDSFATMTDMTCESTKFDVGQVFGDGYGMGLMRFTENDAERGGTLNFYGHLGNLNFVSVLLYDPVERWGVAVLSNNRTQHDLDEYYDVALALIDALLDDEGVTDAGAGTPCGTVIAPDGDAGVGDAGIADAGRDGGLLADSGRILDAGRAVDAGTDAGRTFDAGRELDASAAIDAGRRLDGGVDADMVASDAANPGFDAGLADGSMIQDSNGTEGGCSCRATPPTGATSTLWWVTPALTLLFWRRRRSRQRRN